VLFCGTQTKVRQVNEFIAGIDTDYNVEDFRKLVKTMYKNIVRDFKTQKFDLVLLKSLPNKKEKQGELFKKEILSIN
jgi:hypothetical protein